MTLKRIKVTGSGNQKANGTYKEVEPGLWRKSHCTIKEQVTDGLTTWVLTRAHKTNGLKCLYSSSEPGVTPRKAAAIAIQVPFSPTPVKEKKAATTNLPKVADKDKENETPEKTKANTDVLTKDAKTPNNNSTKTRNNSTKTADKDIKTPTPKKTVASQQTVESPKTVASPPKKIHTSCDQRFPPLQGWVPKDADGPAPTLTLVEPLIREKRLLDRLVECTDKTYEYRHLMAVRMLFKDLPKDKDGNEINIPGVIFPDAAKHFHFELNKKDLHARRLRQIELGKNTPEYKAYIEYIPKKKRSKGYPTTPKHTTNLSKRRFDSVVQKWRRSLHRVYEGEVAELMKKAGVELPDFPESPPHIKRRGRVKKVDKDQEQSSLGVVVGNNKKRNKKKSKHVVAVKNKDQVAKKEQAKADKNKEEDKDKDKSKADEIVLNKEKGKAKSSSKKIDDIDAS